VEAVPIFVGAGFSRPDQGGLKTALYIPHPPHPPYPPHPTRPPHPTYFFSASRAALSMFFTA